MEELQGVPLPRRYAQLHPDVQYAEQQQQQLWYDRLHQALEIDHMLYLNRIIHREEKNPDYQKICNCLSIRNDGNILHFYYNNNNNNQYETLFFNTT